MSADFWAGYISGAAGILIGNPLDLIKTRVQAGPARPAPTPTATEVVEPAPAAWRAHFDKAGTLVRGASAPILGYGALNALLFVTYNRTLAALTAQPGAIPTGLPPDFQPDHAWKIWTAGAAAGFATFVVSAPTELIKCRAQVSTASTVSSLSIAKDVWRAEGLRGLYCGGGITSVRDAVGYGFYFLSYEWSRAALRSPDDTQRTEAMKVLLCGGLAGIVTWACIFPLDVIKTRYQTQALHAPPVTSTTPLLSPEQPTTTARLSTFAVARHAYQTEGVGVFFRGLPLSKTNLLSITAALFALQHISPGHWPFAHTKLIHVAIVPLSQSVPSILIQLDELFGSSLIDD